MPEPERLEFSVFEACCNTTARVNHVTNFTHRSIRNRGSRLFLVAAAVAMLLASATTSAQERTTLRKVEILGLQQRSPDQVIATSGLKVGDLIDASMIDAAADKLMRSGWFQSVNYRVRTADSDSTVIFEVVEKLATPASATADVLGVVVWKGNRVLSTDVLSNVSKLRAGSSADRPRIESGLEAVLKEYSRSGYVATEIIEVGTRDPVSRQMNYEFTILEGGQYRMGALVISGLASTDAQLLKSRWTLSPNTVFDGAYVEQFRTTVIRPFIASRTQRTGIRSRFEINTKPDTQKQTVDVIITFK